MGEVNTMPEKIKITLKCAVLTILLLTGASVIGYLFDDTGFPETNIVITYLLAVHMIAWLTEGFLWGILSSIAATFLFNYFFTEPYLTFSVNDPSYMITFVIMTIVALITSTIVSHAKKSALDARQKEAETKAVYNLTNHLTDADNMQDIVGYAIDEISEYLGCQAACLCFQENGMPENFFIQHRADHRQIRRETEDKEEIKGRIEQLKTSYSMGAEFYDWPIYGHEKKLGIIRIPLKTAQTIGAEQMRLLRSMIESVALAMDRLRVSALHNRSREETIQERYRANLLRAISHDLRTPLSGIMGTSEMIMDMSKQDDPRYDLASAIHKDADWLHSLVENILSLTRLQEGKLILNKQPEAVEEVLAVAIERISKQWPKYEIDVSMPNELLMIPMDAKLIRQVLINLLDNAIKHTPPDGEIGILVEKNENLHFAIFKVIDSGSGISQEDLPHIFQMFYTSHTQISDAKHGIGLGLTICDAIIKAHGGNIEVKNRINRTGAEFTFTLPMEVQIHE